MNIVYMGTPEIAAVILEKLIHSKHHIQAVVTQPDKPKGRGKQMQASPVKELALNHNIPVYQPLKAKEEAFLAILKEINPDIIVVAAFGQILTKSVLELPKYGCINVHASLLPKYRGAAPIQWAIIDGEEKTGITIMHMDAGIDTGDMILKEEILIAPKETAGTLHDKLAVCGGSLLLKALEEIEAGTAVREKQEETEATYVKVLDKAMGHLNFREPAIKLERFIRGLNPWPSAYTYLEGKTLKIWDAEVLDETMDGQPGEVVRITRDSIVIKTGQGSLALKEIQLEGKKRITVDAFLRGFNLQQGTILN
ncbi:methionyl-tRNA formyltransferase [Anaerocolumna cellulosilytica]|uniref:Methionyl-tRNA formyltransferase n=1 Tax=Anaerocolumna cellulosilytica TaxID=433286 RepID=A0A6S6QZS7_9FIRM|nr:methionyl-tRNA formyltransferase [Anaerocolumna cellulosilytica]MBB5197073.1 methionyl-tRNA formyltransferase [Anaerocolumna cellulosilytica]BCJ95286.1 methionyl-tRNA formyltransferase [Anaerocolumna cellulosilytica]